MSRKLICKVTHEVDHDIEAVWSILSKFDAIATWIPLVAQCTTDGEWIDSIRTAVTVSGDRYIEKLVILDHEKHIISYLFEEPLQFSATGLYGKQELESIAPGKTLLTWTSDAESYDEDLKETMNGLIQLCIAGLVELLGKRHKWVPN